MIEKFSYTVQAHSVFAYIVQLLNLSDRPARHMGRHWLLADANGKVQEVRTDDDDYKDTFGTELQSSVGTMNDSDRMLPNDGTHFPAESRLLPLSILQTLH